MGDLLPTFLVLETLESGEHRGLALNILEVSGHPSPVLKTMDNGNLDLDLYMAEVCDNDGLVP